MNASGKIVHMWNKQEIEFEEMKILRGSKSFESKTIYQSIGGIHKLRRQDSADFDPLPTVGKFTTQAYEVEKAFG